MKLCPHPCRIVGIRAHRHGQSAVIMDVSREYFGVTVKPAQASAVRRIDRHFNCLPAFAQSDLNGGQKAAHGLTG
jgi:hypothetical protein